MTEWTNPPVTSTPPGTAEARPVEQYQPVNRDERVATGERGAIDVIFDRGSRMLVGPRCDLVLDESVYDPRLDEVVGFDVFSQTFCVVRGGAGAETIVLETPIATVTISAAAATVTYASGSPETASADGVPTPVLAHRAATGPGGGEARLVAILDARLGEGAGFVEVVADGERAVLRRPGFAVEVGAATGLSAPAPADPGDVAEALGQLADAGPGSSDDAAGELAAAEPGYVDVLRAIGPAAPYAVAPASKCAAAAFCDAEVTKSPFSLSATFP